MTYDVVLLGSINLDVKSFVSKFPEYGNTSSAKHIELVPGGKGANQAVAVSRLGGNVAFIGAVGADSAGKQMRDNLESHNVTTRFIKQDKANGTGTFVIIVDDEGENTMVGTLGANSSLTKQDITNAFKEISAPVLLLQMETSQESILESLKQAKEKGMYIILDPAPADGYFEEALPYANCVTPNQQETKHITGVTIKSIDDAKKAAKIIANKGVESVIIKMGKDGNLVYHNNEFTYIESHKINAVDTVGAGDTFAGALASHYAQNKDLIEAVKFGNTAAAIKVSRLGGQLAIPAIDEVNSFN